MLPVISAEAQRVADLEIQLDAARAALRSLNVSLPSLPPSCPVCAPLPPSPPSASGRRLQASDWPDFSVSRFSEGDCEEAGSFTEISFDNAELFRSNLGGQGGRCNRDLALCIDGAPTPSSPHDILIHRVGRTASGARIDLRITNETAYRAWSTEWNGVRRQRQYWMGTYRVGYFGALNLLGPRSRTQRPIAQFWNDALTFVQLRLTFLHGATGAPLALGKTFITFYDVRGC